jgi:hypothetical protein
VLILTVLRQLIPRFKAAGNKRAEAREATEHRQQRASQLKEKT